MEAIVLAGGLGTRLRSEISDLPKPMAPINNKPFLEYVLKYLRNNNIERVILSVGYKWEIIQKYFGNNFEGMEVVYSVEDEPLGTGGAIKKALSYSDEELLFVVNGDTYFNVDIFQLLSAAKEKDADLTMSLKFLEDFDRYGSVETGENEEVVKFTEKSYRKSGNINGGIYVMKKSLLDDVALGAKFSFEEFMHKNINKLKIFGFISSDYFIDIGIPEDYLRAQSELSGHI